MMPDTRACTKCGTEKPYSEFYRHPKGKNGYSSVCKACHKEYGKAQKKTATGKEVELRYVLKRKYNITPERFAEMLAEQDGLCFICRRKSAIRLSVDHDHACCPGKVSCGLCVRRLLCKGCNYHLLGRVCQETKLGKAHAIEVLRRAIGYLEGAP